MVHAPFLVFFFFLWCVFSTLLVCSNTCLFYIRITVLNHYLSVSESLHDLPFHTHSCRGKVRQVSFLCNVRQLIISPQAFLNVLCHCLH